jgi:hypothetical protein
MDSYCWGDRLIPHLILGETDTHVVVEIGEQLHKIPPSKIVGRCNWPYRPGDRVRILMGYNWHQGTVGIGLSVALDSGRHCPIWSDNNVRRIVTPSMAQAEILGAMRLESIPMPELDECEEIEMSAAQEYGLLESLKVGDRVKIVLAGPPLEFLTGLSGTVDGAETFGLIPVFVNDYGLKILKREQLDLIDPDLQIGSRVVHKSRWPGKSEPSRLLVPI